MKLFGSEFFELLRKYAEGIRGNLQDAGLSLVPAGSGAGYFGDDDDDVGDEYCGDGDEDEEETADGTGGRSDHFPPDPEEEEAEG